MEKRVFLAILISFGILAVYQAYFAPPPVTPPQSSSALPAPAAPAVSTPAQAPGAPAASQPAGAATTGAAPAAAPVVSEAAPRDITVDTDTVAAVFTTRGGAL